MIKCKINNISYEFKPNLTIMQACSSLNIDIPRFCYHERLSIAGNCRMCLVEVKNSPKPVASCAMPLMNNMEIFTNTLSVKKAREGILEFLLANHPLDCPICDQGSECDLQDQAMVYGSDRGRFYEVKRAVEDKECGPLVKTVMTRCIHCTRCIRFTTEIAGLPVFGLTGRGGAMEVGTYVDNVINSELSGNIIDLCPVGALTSKPFAFTARAWELNGVDSVDVFDALGSNIKLDCRGSDVMRVLPRVNDLINEEWISDKVRFSYDGYKRQRLLSPMLNKNGKLEECGWMDIVSVFKSNLIKNNAQKGDVIGYLGDTVDLDTTVVFKDFLLSLNNNAIFKTNYQGVVDFRSDYLFNMPLNAIEQVDLCLIIGSNVKLDSPVLNARLRKHFVQNNTLVVTIGATTSLTYNTYHLGNSLKILLQIIEGKHWFCNRLVKTKMPLIIFGSGFLSDQVSVNFLKLIKDWLKLLSTVNLNVKTCSLNLLPLNASFVGSLDIGFQQVLTIKSKSKTRLIYALDNLKPLYKKREGDFIIYQGHHGHNVLNKADIVLPGSMFHEKDGYYINLLGMTQKGRFVSKPLGLAREDWKIFVFLMVELFKSVTFNNIIATNLVLKSYINNSKQKALFLRKRVNELTPFVENEMFVSDINFLTLTKYSKRIYKLNNTISLNRVTNYYMTDTITESSVIMAACSDKFVLEGSNYLQSF